MWSSAALVHNSALASKCRLVACPGSDPATGAASLAIWQKALESRNLKDMSVSLEARWPAIDKDARMRVGHLSRGIISVIATSYEPQSLFEAWNRDHWTCCLQKMSSHVMAKASSIVHQHNAGLSDIFFSKLASNPESLPPHYKKGPMQRADLNVQVSPIDVITFSIVAWLSVSLNLRSTFSCWQRLFPAQAITLAILLVFCDSPIYCTKSQIWNWNINNVQRCEHSRTV